MTVNTCVSNKYEHFISGLAQKGHVTYSSNGRYVSTLGLLLLYRVGYYQESFAILQSSIEKMLSLEVYKKANPLHASIVLMYTEN
jgi:hypothetical protein